MTLRLQCILVILCVLLTTAAGSAYQLTQEEASAVAETIAFVEVGGDVNAVDPSSSALTRLHEAAIFGYVRVAEILVSHGARVDATTKHGRTPLSFATGHEPMVRFLVERGAAVDTASERGTTPLHIAAGAGEQRVVRLLLDSGAQVRAADGNGETALHWAAGNVHADVAEFLRRRGGGPDGSLFVLAAKGDTERLGRMLSMRSERIHSVDSAGWTALHWATAFDQEHAARILVEHGADTLAKTRTGGTTFELAVRQGNMTLLDLFAENSRDGDLVVEGEAALREAARGGHTDAVEFLLGKGVAPTSADSEGETPLHKAAAAGHEEVVRIILEQGGEVGATDRFSRTPLYNAVQKGHVEIAELLMRSGANALERDAGGQSSLEVAAAAGHLGVLGLLIDQSPPDTLTKVGQELAGTAAGLGRQDVIDDLFRRGVEVDTRHKVEEWTPLHYAAFGKSPEMVSYLVRKRLFVNARDKNGQTPLHLAAGTGRYVAAKALIANGAAVDSKDDNGETPLIMAASRDQPALVALLIESGATVNAMDNNRHTALHAAAILGHALIAKILMEQGADPEAGGRDGFSEPLAFARMARQHEVAELIERRSAAEESGSQSPNQVEVIIRELRNSDSEVRYRACKRLGKMGPNAKDAVPAMLKVLVDDREPGVRETCAKAFGEVGPVAVPTLDAFLKRQAVSRDFDPMARMYVAEALGEIGPAAESAVPALIGVLRDPGLSAYAAGEALGKIGPGAAGGVPQLVGLLTSEYDEVRYGAAEALAGIGPDAKQAVNALIGALRDQNESVRYMAADALREIGSGARQALPALLAALSDENYLVRTKAAGAVQRIGPDVSAIAALRRALKDQDDGVRIRAAWALGAIGSDAVPTLVTLLRGTDSELSRLAIQALGTMGPPAKASVPALIELLEDKVLGHSAAWALGKIGPSAEASVPALIGLLQKGPASSQIIYALAWIGPAAAPATPALVQSLQEGDHLLRLSSARALGEIGPGAKASIPALVHALDDEEDSVRVNAAYALVKMGESNKGIPLLIRTLTSARGSILESASKLLAKTGPLGGPALPQLTDLLARSQGMRRIRVAYALAALDQSGNGVSVLASALQSGSKDERIEAARCLAELGPKARTAIPAMRKAERDGEKDVRAEVREALRTIGAG